MKDKQKEIEEMADILCQSKNYKCDGEDCKCIKQATDLYNADYRNCKDKVVLTREEYKSLTNELDKGDYGEFESGYAQASKETAREIFSEIYKLLFLIRKQDYEDSVPYYSESVEEFDDKLYEIAKQYGVIGEEV